MQNNKINLVLASDQNYVKLLVPCIISILYNKKPSTAIDIYILQSGISNYHQQKIKELQHFNNVNNCKINFIDINEKLPDIVNQKVEHIFYTTAILYKLAIPKLFKCLDRALYLDTDTIVRTDLLELYNQDFEDNYVVVKRNNPLTYRSAIYNDGYTLNENYGINSGVLLFNIKKIVNDNKLDELINFKKYTKGLPEYADQDILADTLKPKLKAMDSKYNTGPIDVDALISMSKASKEHYYKALKETKILHFVASIKPFNLKKLWKLTTTYREFYRYYQMSYLKINPVKLKLIFLWSNAKRFRKQISGTRFEHGGKKVFYFFNLEFVIRKGS